MYKIGEFSKLCGLSTSTLRDYEKRQLFQPASVDRWTGYRYYDGAQLASVSGILALRDVGFTLDEISSLKIHRSPAHQLVEIIEKKANGMETAGAEHIDRLERILDHIFLIKNGGIPSAEEFRVKRVESVRIASTRRTVPMRDFAKNLEEMWLEVSAAIPDRDPKRKAPHMLLFHSCCEEKKRLDFHHDRDRLDMEVAEPVLPSYAGNGDISVYTLPVVPRMACVIHKGSISSICDTLRKLQDWIECNQQKIAGPLRKIYHRGVWDTQDPEEHVTELQIPLQ